MDTIDEIIQKLAPKLDALIALVRCDSSCPISWEIQELLRAELDPVLAQYSVRPFGPQPDKHAASTEKWLTANEKTPTDVEWSLYPIGMVGRWIARAESAEELEEELSLLRFKHRVEKAQIKNLTAQLRERDELLCEALEFIDTRYNGRPLNLVRRIEAKLSAPAAQGQKRPIDRPCSACGDGDTAMEYHDHYPPFSDGPAAQEGKP